MKKLIMLCMLLLPIGMVAQELKIAVVKTMEVFNAMPEISHLESEMATLTNHYQTNIKKLQDEYTMKTAEYINLQDSLPENILKSRLQEIEGIRERIDNLQQVFYQDREERQEKLLAPIREKVQKAIEQVGDENGYTLIIDSQAVHYVGRTAIDATEKVKTKLGLKL